MDAHCRLARVSGTNLIHVLYFRRFHVVVRIDVLVCVMVHHVTN